MFLAIKKAPYVCDIRGLDLKRCEDQFRPSSGQKHIQSTGNRQRMPRVIPTGATDPCGKNARSLLMNSMYIGVPLLAK
jgi:hypothetical protein